MTVEKYNKCLALPIYFLFCLFINLLTLSSLGEFIINSGRNSDYFLLKLFNEMPDCLPLLNSTSCK